MSDKLHISNQDRYDALKAALKGQKQVYIEAEIKRSVFDREITRQSVMGKNPQNIQFLNQQRQQASGVLEATGEAIKITREMIGDLAGNDNAIAEQVKADFANEPLKTK